MRASSAQAAEINDETHNQGRLDAQRRFPPDSQRVLLIQPQGNFMLRGITHPVCRDLMMTATYLRRRGYTVRVWDRCIDSTDLTLPAGGFPADAAIFFISQSSSVKDAIAVSNRLRANGTVVIWADMVALLGIGLPDSFQYFDFLLTGEYCITADRLLKALSAGTELREVAGIAFLDGEERIVTEKRPLPDFSFLGPIDWSLIDVEKCLRRFPGCKRMLYLCASVGCPYSCGFCSTPACYGARRKRPIQHVLSEIDYLTECFAVDGISFSDELLSFTDEELEQIGHCRQKHHHSFVWGGETRPQTLTKEKLIKMYHAGCRWLLFGLESGSGRIRERIGKQYDSDHVRKVVSWCTELGIETFGSFIIGFPGETREDLRQTVQFALSLELDAFLFNYFVMIAQTPLYDTAVRTGEFQFHSILEYDTVVNTDLLDQNFSEIPYRELATVKAYFDFLTITRKKKTSAAQSAGKQFVQKAANSAVEYLRNSPREMLLGLYSVAKRGFCVVFYPTMNPDVRKQYGLFNINRKSKKPSVGEQTG